MWKDRTLGTILLGRVIRDLMGMGKLGEKEVPDEQESLSFHTEWQRRQVFIK